jgi:hypothetical protein
MANKLEHSDRSDRKVSSTYGFPASQRMHATVDCIVCEDCYFKMRAKDKVPVKSVSAAQWRSTSNAIDDASSSFACTAA